MTTQLNRYSLQVHNHGKYLFLELPVGLRGIFMGSSFENGIRMSEIVVCVLARFCATMPFSWK